MEFRIFCEYLLAEEGLRHMGSPISRLRTPTSFTNWLVATRCGRGARSLIFAGRADSLVSIYQVDSFTPDYPQGRTSFQVLCMNMVLPLSD
jgi:hypothetical protein